MAKPPEEPDLNDYEEEAVPFDDVLKKLLAAKPVPRNAVGPKPRKAGARRPSTEES